MQHAPLSYTWRNILVALLLAVELGCFVAPIVLFLLEERQYKTEGRAGWEGEAGGLLVAVLGPLALYVLLFFIKAMQSALQKGGRPMSGWLVLLGLLPVLGLTLLVVLSTYPR